MGGGVVLLLFHKSCYHLPLPQHRNLNLKIYHFKQENEVSHVKHCGNLKPRICNNAHNAINTSVAVQTMGVGRHLFCFCSENMAQQVASSA